jgi:hypothetical protein
MDKVLLAVAATAFVLADLLNPRYSPVSEPVSRYVNGTAGWLVTVAILAIGVAALRVVRRAPGGAGRILMAVWTAGLFVAAVFPADPPGQYANPSTAELVHGVAALTALAVFPAGAVLLSRPGRSANRPARRDRPRLRWVAYASVLFTAAFAVTMVDVMDGPDLGIGGWPTVLGFVERLVIATNLIWMAAFSRAGLPDGNGDASFVPPWWEKTGQAEPPRPAGPPS